MSGPDDAVTPQAIERCERLIRPYIRRTPVMTFDRSELGLPAGPLTLKLELMQHSGAFKARGAFTNLLTREIPKAGVVAASGGNHGAAVAYAAMRLNKPASIFVPSVSSPAKIARIREYGADADESARGRAPRRRGSRRARGGFAGATPHRRTCIPDRTKICATHGTCNRRGDRRGAEDAVVRLAHRGGAGWRLRVFRHHVGRVPAGCRRTRGGHHQRRQHDGGRFRLGLMSVFALPVQPVDATQALNLSAGVSNCKVSRGRSLS